MKNWGYQNCIIIKHALPARWKAPHQGQFSYDHQLASDCYNYLGRFPCVVDFRLDTGCGWHHVGYQKRCKHFPNNGIYDTPVKVNTSDLSWLRVDQGDIYAAGQSSPVFTA